MAEAKSRLHELAARGQSVWFDTLSRDLVQLRRAEADDGGGRRHRRHLEPDDLPEGALAGRRVRRGPDGAARGDRRPERDLLLARARRTSATPATCSGRRTTHRTAIDGYVSMEVEPGLAYDTEGTFEQARWIATEVDRPNLYVKIPATEPGLPAIEDCIAHGTSINITLIFSLDRYKAVVEAYLRGLERLVAGGGDPSKVASVASFFVSRVDTEADKRLDAVGHPELQGKLAVANAKLAYQHFLEAFSGPRWEYLEGKGANKQRCLWASTSTKNPAYRDVIYVEELIGPETVNTMPLETIEAFQDHGEVRGDTVLEGRRRGGGAARSSSPRPASTTTTSRSRSRRRACRSSPTRSTRSSRASAPSAARWRLHDERRRELVERIWSRDPTVWTGARRGPVARLARRAVADARGRRAAAAARRLASPAEIDAVVLLGMGGSSLAPEVIRQTFGQRDASTSSTRRTRRRSATSRRSSTSRARCSSRRRSRARRSRRARTPTTSGSRAANGEQWVAITDPGSALEELARERGFARDLPRRADDRRPLLGALAVRAWCRRR